MAIWNVTEESTDLGELLARALPHIDTGAEMLKLSPAQLAAVENFAASTMDNVIEQQMALADLMANADQRNLRPRTLASVGWVLNSLTERAELASRIASIAKGYADPETKSMYERICSGHADGKGVTAQAA